MPVGIAQFAQQFEIQHGQMAAASIVATIPAILLMFFGQRFVIQGLTLGSVKGWRRQPLRLEGLYLSRVCVPRSRRGTSARTRARRR